MRSLNLSWRNARRHKFAWRGSNIYNAQQSTFLLLYLLWRTLLQFHYTCTCIDWLIWAASSEFVSSSIPSWQISTAHVQPFRGARDLAFCLKVPLDSLLVWASSEGSGETARMRRLAWTFAARIGDKYQIRLTRSICFLVNSSAGDVCKILVIYCCYYCLTFNAV